MQTLILIPPSEGKVSGGQYPPLKELNTNVKMIFQRFKAYKGDLGALYGVKGKALQEAINANESIISSPTMPAIERYSGVVYDGLGYKTLSKQGKEFCHQHVRIVSALFGLLTPQTCIPDYKLKIEKLDAAKFWLPINTELLRDYFIIDLLPQSYGKAVSYQHGMRLDFIITKAGRVVPAGHFGKLIKGKFIRWLCEHQITDPKYFDQFNEDGFKFDGQNFKR